MKAKDISLPEAEYPFGVGMGLANPQNNFTTAYNAEGEENKVLGFGFPSCQSVQGTINGVSASVDIRSFSERGGISIENVAPKFRPAIPPVSIGAVREGFGVRCMAHVLNGEIQQCPATTNNLVNSWGNWCAPKILESVTCRGAEGIETALQGEDGKTMYEILVAKECPLQSIRGKTQEEIETLLEAYIATQKKKGRGTGRYLRRANRRRK